MVPSAMKSYTEDKITSFSRSNSENFDIRKNIKYVAVRDVVAYLNYNFSCPFHRFRIRHIKQADPYLFILWMLLLYHFIPRCLSICQAKEQCIRISFAAGDLDHMDNFFTKDMG